MSLFQLITLMTFLPPNDIYIYIYWESATSLSSSLLSSSASSIIVLVCNQCDNLSHYFFEFFLLQLLLFPFMTYLTVFDVLKMKLTTTTDKQRKCYLQGVTTMSKNYIMHEFLIILRIPYYEYYADSRWLSVIFLFFIWHLKLSTACWCWYCNIQFEKLTSATGTNWVACLCGHALFIKITQYTHFVSYSHGGAPQHVVRHTLKKVTK